MGGGRGSERRAPAHKRRQRIGRDPPFPVNTCNERDARAEGPTELTTEPESPMMLERRCVTKRSIAMMRDAGLARQETAYVRHIPAVLDELPQLPQPPRLVTSPEEREALEREMRQRPDRLGRVLVGSPLQQAWDAAALPG